MDKKAFGAAVAVAGKKSIDPTVIEGAVSDWLDNHPEATTTVEDGAISYQKLDSTLKGKMDDVGDLKTAISNLDNKVLAEFVYSFTDNVTAGSDYKGYLDGKKKVYVDIPVSGKFDLNVITEAFDKYTLYIQLSNSPTWISQEVYFTNTKITVTNTAQAKIVALTLWAKAGDVASSGSFTYRVSIANPDGLEADVESMETEIAALEADVSVIGNSLLNEKTYSFEDNVTSGGEYKGYVSGKKVIDHEIPCDMHFTYRVDTECFTRYKLYVSYNGTDLIALPNYVNVGEDIPLISGYQGNSDKKFTIYVPKTNDITGTDNVTSSGTFTFGVTSKVPENCLITKLNPRSEMLPKIENARASIDVSGHSGENRYKCLTIAHLSDIHADGDNLKRVVDFCDAYLTYIDDIVCTGDLVRDHAIASGVEEDYSWWHDSGADNVLAVIGNHDTASLNNGSYDWRGFGKVNTYNKYIAPFVSGWGVTQPQDAATEGKCYYYKDYAAYGVRLIVLDCMYYDTAEDTWFASVLESARTAEYGVIVCAHGLGANGQNIDCNFSSLNGTGGQVIVDTSTYIYNANVHSKIDDFITAGGTFICFLGGHFHKDYFGVVSGTTNVQPFILIDTAAYNAPLRDHSVTKFERSQDCFNIVSIDTHLHLIKLVRIGYQYDCWMRKKETLCYNYNTHTLIKD